MVYKIYKSCPLSFSCLLDLTEKWSSLQNTSVRCLAFHGKRNFWQTSDPEGAGLATRPPLCSSPLIHIFILTLNL